MAINIKILRKEQRNSGFFVVVEFKEGTIIATEELSIRGLNSKDQVENMIRNRAKQLSKTFNNFNDMEEGAITLIAPPLPINQQEAREWSALYKEYVNKKELIDLGLFTETELNLSSLKTTLKSKYKEEYIK